MERSPRFLFDKCSSGLIEAGQLFGSLWLPSVGIRDLGSDQLPSVLVNESLQAESYRLGATADHPVGDKIIEGLG